LHAVSMQGFSKVRYRSAEQFQRCERLCGEAAQSLSDVDSSISPQERDRGVAQRGPGLRRVPAGHRACVFPEAHIADAMHRVFD